MQKIKLSNGDVVVVSNNEAHTLIDSGQGKLYRPTAKKTKKTKKKYRNKMMRTG